MRSVFIVLVAVLISMTGLGQPSNGQESVGYVARVEGDWSRAQLQRGTMVPRGVRPGEEIFRGDVIIVLPPTIVQVDTVDGSVFVCMNGIESIKCTCEDGVLDMCRRSFNNSGRIFGIDFTRVGTMNRWLAPSSTNLITRAGDPLAWRVGKGVRQIVQSGDRPLWVGWTGGQPPTTVEVSQGGRRMITQSTSETSMVLPRLDLHPGELSIVVRDESSRAELVVLVGSVPPLPKILESGAVNSTHQTIRSAYWLANQGQGEYLLEAVRTVLPITTTSQPANILRRAIGAGFRPQDY